MLPRHSHPASSSLFSLRAQFFLVMLFAATLLSGCNLFNKSDTDGVNKLTVGVLLPLTGSWATQGHNAEAALSSALDIIHAQYSADLKIELKILDTKGEPETALAQLQTLHAAGVRVVIGPMTSAEAEVMRGYANSNDMLLVSPSATASDLSYDDNLIMLAPNDRHQSDALVKLMQADGITRVAVAYIDDLYGRSFQREFARAAATAGITLLPAVTLDATTPNYAATATALEQSAAASPVASTAVLLIESDVRAAALANVIATDSQLRSVRWYSGEAVTGSPLFVEDSGLAKFAAATRLTGFTLAMESDMFDSSRPLVRDIIGKRLQGEVNAYALTSWDALWLVAYTQKQAPYRDTATFKANLIAESITFGNIFGFANPLDANGNVVAGRYARFQLVENASNSYRWQYRGTYIKPSASTAFAIDFVKPYPPTTGSVTLGALLPLTGQSAEIGLQARKALEAAISVANSQFGATVPGISYTLEIRDTASDPGQALQAIQELNSRGIVGIVGPYLSSEVAAVANYANQHGMTLISPAATAPSLGSTGHTMLLSPNDTRQAAALVSLIKARNIEHVIVLHRDDIYGAELSQAFAAAFPGRTDTVAYNGSNLNAPAVLASANALLSSGSGATAVLAISYAEIADLLSAAPVGSPLLGVRWFGADGTSQLQALTGPGTAAANAAQVQFTASVFSHYGGVGQTSILPALNVTLALDSPGATTYTINSYDALWYLAATYAELGSQASADAVWATLTRSPYFSGIGGPFALDEHSHRAFGIFQFHTVTQADAGYQWQVSAVYLNNHLYQGELVIY